MYRFKAIVFYSLLFFSTPALSKGSKSPKPEAVPPPPIKFLTSVNEIQSGILRGSGADDLRFEYLLEEQFSHALAVSKGFVVSPKNLMDSQFVMDATIVGFELISENGAKFGFSPIESFLPIGVDFDVHVKTVLLTLKMEAIDPLSGRIIASVMSKAQYKDNKASFGLKYLNFVQASFVSSSQTPLSLVTGTALNNGANMLSDKLRALRWQGLVTDNFRENEWQLLEINGGVDVGIKKGMFFEVLGAGGSSQGRVKATVEVYRVDMTRSWARVIELNPEWMLEPISNFDLVYYAPEARPSSLLVTR